MTTTIRKPASVLKRVQRPRSDVNNWLAQNHAFNVTSQCGEDGIIQKVSERDDDDDDDDYDDDDDDCRFVKLRTMLDDDACNKRRDMIRRTLPTS